jgi:hypothetical protein
LALARLSQLSHFADVSPYLTAQMAEKSALHLDGADAGWRLCRQLEAQPMQHQHHVLFGFGMP